MSQPIFMSSYNDEKSLCAVFEENENTAWLYLCGVTNQKDRSSTILSDVFICNTVELIEHTALSQYSKNSPPPITTAFGHPEGVCPDIQNVIWNLNWIGNKSVLLTKDQKPWALLSQGEKRGMCKAIKKSGPWGNNWNEKRYRKLL